MVQSAEADFAVRSTPSRDFSPPASCRPGPLRPQATQNPDAHPGDDRAGSRYGRTRRTVSPTRTVPIASGVA